MDSKHIIFYIYLIIGMIIAVYDWNINQKNTVKNPNDEMAVMYMAFVALVWPLRICSWIFK